MLAKAIVVPQVRHYSSIDFFQHEFLYALSNYTLHMEIVA